jgi:hypothetical protein
MSALGQKADIVAPSTDVRFTLESGHASAPRRCPLCAKSGHWAIHVGRTIAQPGNALMMVALPWATTWCWLVKLS